MQHANSLIVPSFPAVDHTEPRTGEIANKRHLLIQGDHLLKRHSALASSLIIAAFWVLWHIPISPILNGVSFPWLFLLEVIPLCILFSWLYINSHGSILLVVLLHVVSNTVVYVLNIPGSASLWAIYVGMNWLLAALIAARYGASRLSRHGRADIERDLWDASGSGA